jgi:hypothetical protein
MGTAASFSRPWRETNHLAWESIPPTARTPGEVRDIILVQHERIRALLQRLERRAARLLATQMPGTREREATRRSALALCGVMAWHIEAENRLLLPLLDLADPLRAAHLRADHEEQLLALRAYTVALEHPSGSAATLALIAWQLADVIAEDMQQEEASVLNAAPICEDSSIRDDAEDLALEDGLE